MVEKSSCRVTTATHVRGVSIACEPGPCAGLHTNLDLCLGDIERQIAEDNLAAGVGAAAGDNDGGLVAVGGGDHRGILGTSTDGGSLGAGTAATATLASALAGTAGSGTLGASGDDLLEGCTRDKKKQKKMRTRVRGVCPQEPFGGRSIASSVGGCSSKCEHAVLRVKVERETDQAEESSVDETRACHYRRICRDACTSLPRGVPCTASFGEGMWQSQR